MRENTTNVCNVLYSTAQVTRGYCSQELKRNSKTVYFTCEITTTTFYFPTYLNTIFTVIRYYEIIRGIITVFPYWDAKFREVYRTSPDVVR